MLGYTLWLATSASAWPKTPTSVTSISGEPDVSLGHFRDGEPPEFSAVLELKSPGTDLDKAADLGTDLVAIVMSAAEGAVEGGAREARRSDIAPSGLALSAHPVFPARQWV